MSTDLKTYWMNKNEAVGVPGTDFNEDNMGIIHPSVNSLFDQFIVPTEGARGFILKGSTYIKILEPQTGGGYKHRVFGSEEDVVVLSAEKRLDAGTSFQPGRDYYIYLCAPNPDQGASLVVSLNSTFPVGYTADNSRKIGGFHTLCVSVGSIGGHPLSDLVAGDILPTSFWDLRHRPTCSAEGMAYVAELDFWADIYLQSYTGKNTKSVFGGTITDTQGASWHISDLASVGKQPLSAVEFQVAAFGSNQQTAISGSADAVTTGGHKDSTGRRMVSNYGLEDCCGFMWQYANEFNSYISYGWTNDMNCGANVYGSIMMVGGGWGSGIYCGSCCRNSINQISVAYNYISCRGRASSRMTR